MLTGEIRFDHEIGGSAARRCRDDDFLVAGVLIGLRFGRMKYDAVTEMDGEGVITLSFRERIDTKDEAELDGSIGQVNRLRDRSSITVLTSTEPYEMLAGIRVCHAVAGRVADHRWVVE